MEADLKLSMDDGDLLEDSSLYRRIIGKLLYLTITKPDISYAVNRLSQFVTSLIMPYLKAAQCVLQYIKPSSGKVLFFSSKSNVHLKAYAEASLPSSRDIQLKVFAYAD